MVGGWAVGLDQVFGWDAKDSLDCVGIADADLDVRFFAEAGVAVDGRSLDEDAADGIEGRLVASFADGVEMAKDSAVQPAEEQVFAAGVPRLRTG